MSTTLRQRKKVLNAVKELDAFPKIPDSYREKSASGGSISVLVFIVIGILVVFEIKYYTATDLKFEYEVDSTIDQKLKINIDMTIAMKCDWIGADILDLTGQRAEMFGALKEEAVYYELSPEQQRVFNMSRDMNTFLREEYHAMHKVLWKTAYMSKNKQLPPRKDFPDKPKDGCRLHGTMTVNKVAGNFHITAGKSVPVFPRGHAHLAMMVRESDYNFSHRIDHFSFGDDTPGIIAPLDSELKTAPQNFHIFQYFIQVIPTTVKTTFSSLETYQYAYTEKDRTINHKEGSHGVPGIFVKYDVNSLKVTVKEEHKPYWQFLVRLCGIVGGIFATSGMVHSLVGFLTDCVCCRFKLGRYKTESGLSSPPPTQNTTTQPLVSDPPSASVTSGTTLLSEDLTSFSTTHLTASS